MTLEEFIKYKRPRGLTKEKETLLRYMDKLSTFGLLIVNHEEPEKTKISFHLCAGGGCFNSVTFRLKGLSALKVICSLNTQPRPYATDMMKKVRKLIHVEMVKQLEESK